MLGRSGWVAVRGPVLFDFAVFEIVHNKWNKNDGIKRKSDH